MITRNRLFRCIRRLTAFARVAVDRMSARFLIDYWEIEGGANVRFVGLPAIHKTEGSRIILGENVKLLSRSMSNPLRINQPCSISTLTSTATIRIDDESGLSGVVICSAQSISIGKRVLIGSNTVIVDTDFHPLTVAERQINRNANAKCAPVQIGNDVFIGTQVIILKGTVLGNGCVVGAGSVVSGEFPSKSIVVGNPARIIKTLK